MAKNNGNKGLKWKIIGGLFLAAVAGVGLFIANIEPVVQPQTMVLGNAYSGASPVPAAPAPVFNSLAPSEATQNEPAPTTPE
jgi:hypothetical protein